MTYEAALIHYLSTAIGALVGELKANEKITENEATKALEIVSSGIDEITEAYRTKNLNLTEKS